MENLSIDVSAALPMYPEATLLAASVRPAAGSPEAVLWDRVADWVNGFARKAWSLG